MINTSSFAENYVLNGGQDSRINCLIIQKAKPSENTRKLLLSYVVPESYNSPTYNQKINDLEFDFSPMPFQRKEKTDQRGNKVIEVMLEAPLNPVTTTISLSATNLV